MKAQHHPGGLYLLSFTEMAERFSYYGMRTILILYLVAAFFGSADASMLYGSYTGLVYLTPLLGGFIADKFWGNRRSIIVGGIVMAVGQFLMFASACFVKQSIFSEGGAISTNVNNTPSLVLMLAGLVALIIGNGFFKPCISTMVGDLYDKGDRRTDSAFTIFYMGINIGSFLAPILCGQFAKGGSWTEPGAFKWGFFCAGMAMTLSVAVFWLGKNKLLVTPDGKPVGSTPKKVESAIDPKERKENVSKNSPIRLWGCIVGAITLAVLFSLNAKNFNDYISAVIYAASIALPILIITDKGLTKQEKMRIGVIYIIACVSIVYWACYEQAGTSLTIFADQQCDRMIGNYEFPTTWLQSINPIAIVILAPLMASLWDMLAKRKKEPSIPAKQGIGLILMSAGYLIIALGTRGLSDGAKTSMWWIWGLYIIHSISELCLSPIGLSMVNKLSPARLASLLMGVWFMSWAASNVLAGKLATYLPVAGEPIRKFMGVEIASLPAFFMIFAVIGGVAGIILLALCPQLKKMMGDTAYEKAQ